MTGFETGARPTGQEEARHFRAHLAILIGLLIQFLHALKCSHRVHPPQGLHNFKNKSIP